VLCWPQILLCVFVMCCTVDSQGKGCLVVTGRLSMGSFGVNAWVN